MHVFGAFSSEKRFECNKKAQKAGRF